MKAKLIFASLFLSMAGLSAQTYQVPVSEQDEPMMKGKSAVCGRFRRLDGSFHVYGGYS